MPLIQVFTSAPAPTSDRGTTLLGELSGIAAARFGKPERWVMTALVPGPADDVRGQHVRPRPSSR